MRQTATTVADDAVRYSSSPFFPPPGHFAPPAFVFGLPGARAPAPSFFFAVETRALVFFAAMSSVIHDSRQPLAKSVALDRLRSCTVMGGFDRLRFVTGERSYAIVQARSCPHEHVVLVSEALS